ncbi:hypothetical protein RDI58_011044 [Solanum bulbocastanum]|uniref:S-protein homolog n=1 Tax=Solanum bulbocastanum TaxID=147425 RepID=A0AAN8TWD0_SOLBU
MNFYNTILIISFLFILSLSGIVATASTKGPLTRYQIWIASDLPNGTNPLFVHCWSKDNDLGTHFLNPGPEGYHWHFRENIWQTTKYKCEFVWVTKTITFYVFESDSDKCRGRGDICYWLVREDGFYFANYINPFPYDLKLMVSW